MSSADMAPEDIDKLTLSDIEGIAARLDAAVKTFREAKALLGGAAAVSQQAPTPLGVAAAPPSILQPHELVQREALLARNRDLPPEILAAERMAHP